MDPDSPESVDPQKREKANILYQEDLARAYKARCPPQDDRAHTH